jgi:hypothetical protein
MAWNPSAKVADCREIARKWGKRQVIILALDGETLQLVTYGETPRLCAEAKRLGDAAYDAVMAKAGGKVTP